MTLRIYNLARKIQGFSLIELMIAITIMGVLCAVAIPSYQDYLIRAKVSNMLAIAQSIKLSVTESFMMGVKPEVAKITNKDVVKEISVAENHVITVLADSEKLGIRPKEREFKLILTPSLDNPEMVFWSCKVEPTDLKRYAPAECRGNTASALAAANQN